MWKLISIYCVLCMRYFILIPRIIQWAKNYIITWLWITEQEKLSDMPRMTLLGSDSVEIEAKFYWNLGLCPGPLSYFCQ